MPYIELKTNVKIEDGVKADLHRMFGREIELIPGKTEKWLMTAVEGEKSMSFAGSDEPCVFVNVSIFGKASDEAYDALTASLCEKIGASLSIPADRIYVKYEEVFHWGWNSMNF